MHMDRQTHMTQLMVAIHNFANVHKIALYKNCSNNNKYGSTSI